MGNTKILVGVLALIIIMLFFGISSVMKDGSSLIGWALIFLSAIIFLIILDRYEKKREKEDRETTTQTK